MSLLDHPGIPVGCVFAGMALFTAAVCAEHLGQPAIATGCAAVSGIVGFGGAAVCMLAVAEAMGVP